MGSIGWSSDEESSSEEEDLSESEESEGEKERREEESEVMRRMIAMIRIVRCLFFRAAGGELMRWVRAETRAWGEVGEGRGGE